jgi:hypothetical protein
MKTCVKRRNILVLRLHYKQKLLDMKNFSGPSLFIHCEYCCYSRPFTSVFTDALCVLIHMTIYSFMFS